MAIRVISNPPNAGDWTRLKQDGDHEEHFVNDPAPALITSPGGVTRPNMSKLVADAQVQIDAAENYANIALSAAEASGPVAGFYATKEDLDTALSGLADGLYEVLADESQDGSATRYTVASGVATFQTRLEAADDGSSLTPSASWDEVPHVVGRSAAPMNAQAQALANQLASSVRRVANAAAARAIDAAYPETLFISGLDGGLFQRDASDTTSAEDGGSYCGTIIRGADYATRGVWKRVFDGAVDFAWFGARGDGAADDTAEILQAIASGHNIFRATGAYVLTDGIDLGEGVTIMGAGNHANYTTFTTDVSDHEIRFVKINKNDGTNYTIRAGKNCELIGVSVLGPQSRYDTPLDGEQWLGRAGTYPTDTDNPDYGIVIYGESVRLERVAVMNFGEAGIYGDDAASNNGACSLQSVTVTACKRGIYGTLYDSTLINCFVTQCVEANIDLVAPSLSIIGGRVEWGAYKGITVKGAGFQMLGTVVDRNGGPGVEIRDTFGATICGFVKRNGAGGDGTNGRYGDATAGVGHFAYRETSDVDSCNIKLHGAQVVSVHGCRFQPGQADNGMGANSPAYNICLVDSDTVTTTGNIIQGNVGDGYNSSYPVTGGSASPGYFNDPTKVSPYTSRQPLVSTDYRGAAGGKQESLTFSVAPGAVYAVTGKAPRYLYELLETGRSGHTAYGYKGFDAGAFLASAGDFNYHGNNVTPTGSTGTDGKINVASNDNTLYVENRTAASVSLVMFIRSS